MSARIIAIGDIHGCAAALRAILEQIAPQPEDTIVALGDYIDRGDDTRGVLEQLLALRDHCTLIPLLGNHEEMLLAICDGADNLLAGWLTFGGDATLASYGDVVPLRIPPEHLEFLRGCRLYWETSRHFFVHGSYDADLPLAKQSRQTLLWGSLRNGLPGPHCSGKTAILGHTSQKSGQIIDAGYLKCIDTRCYGNGWLTAMDVDTGQLWQADKRGRIA